MLAVCRVYLQGRPTWRSPDIGRKKHGGTHPKKEIKKKKEHQNSTMESLKSLHLSHFHELANTQGRRHQDSIPIWKTREPQREKNICSVGTSHISQPGPGTLPLGVSLWTPRKECGWLGAHLSQPLLNTVPALKHIFDRTQSIIQR